MPLCGDKGLKLIVDWLLEGIRLILITDYFYGEKYLR